MRERVWSIDIDGQPFIAEQTGRRQLRCAFDVTISPGNALAFADIRIYNLAKGSTVAQRSSIVLRAGFTDSVDAIFTGFITNVLREREPGSPDIITRFVCWSGQPAVDRASAQISLGPGVTIAAVLRALASEWPAPIDIDESQFADDPVFTTGYVIDGDIPTAIDSLSYAYKFDWVFDSGRLVISKPEMPRSIPPIKVDQFNGMIGIPEVTRGKDGIGIFVATQLNPFARINGVIDVESEFSTFNTGNLFISELSGDATANGEYNVFAIKHSGDSHSEQWRTEYDGIRVGSVTPTPTTPDNGALVWGARVSQEFRVRVREIGASLSIDPNWLMAVMGFETRYTFSPSVRNPGSSATGLIQFIESTARKLETTTARLARMTAVEQLDFVEAYFVKNGYVGRIRNMGDAYLAVLWPAAIGRPDSYIMWQRDTGPYQAEYAANSGLDVNRDGNITRGEAVASVNASYQRGLLFLR